MRLIGHRPKIFKLTEFSWRFVIRGGSRLHVEDLTPGNRELVKEVQLMHSGNDIIPIGFFDFDGSPVINIRRDYRGHGFGRALYKTAINNFGPIFSSDAMSKYSYWTWLSLMNDVDVRVTQFCNGVRYVPDDEICFAEGEYGCYESLDEEPIFVGRPNDSSYDKPFWDGLHDQTILTEYVYPNTENEQQKPKSPLV